MSHYSHKFTFVRIVKMSNPDYIDDRTWNFFIKFHKLNRLGNFKGRSGERFYFMRTELKAKEFFSPFLESIDGHYVNPDATHLNKG